mmetsp:Transcript_17104/g.48913  ORF Transcript_17104/g.48913 Transcript_17104/m.48913 type:complete len:210 (-) Transcript_17104:1650-2279(-)
MDEGFHLASGRHAALACAPPAAPSSSAPSSPSCDSRYAPGSGQRARCFQSKRLGPEPTIRSLQPRQPDPFPSKSVLGTPPPPDDCSKARLQSSRTSELEELSKPKMTSANWTLYQPPRTGCRSLNDFTGRRDRTTMHRSGKSSHLEGRGGAHMQQALLPDLRSSTSARSAKQSSDAAVSELGRKQGRKRLINSMGRNSKEYAIPHIWNS